jgi:toxin ParE1/3/4
VARYSLSKEAKADLDTILRYSIETFGVERAERYYLTLEECLERVASDPMLGRTIAGRSRTFFQYNCQRHGIFYVTDDDGVFIVRVLHLAMDFKRHLPQ